MTLRTPTKEELLEGYTRRKPQEFVQFDGFNPPTHPVGPGTEDADGDELWGGHRTWELMIGAEVRVLIRTDTTPEVAARMLRKIADWIDRGGMYPPSVEELERMLAHTTDDEETA